MGMRYQVKRWLPLLLLGLTLLTLLGLSLMYGFAPEWLAI
jgi:hypothetical protein